MLWALAATGRLNWVVNFQASTLISMMLLNRASRGARGKEATNNVMKPNWITGDVDRRDVGEITVRGETLPSVGLWGTLQLVHLSLKRGR